MTNPVSTGWWMVIGSAVCMMATSGLSFWTLGVYVHPLEEEFGWSRAQVSAATSITFLVSGLMGPLSGSIVDRSGVRLPLFCGAMGLAAVLASLSRIESLWHFYLLYAGLALSRVWVNYIPFLRLMVRWFPNRMGAPVGVMGLGFSAAGLVFVPMATAFIGALGWRGSYLASALVLLVITLPIISRLRAPVPSSTGPAPTRGRGHDLGLRRALGTRAFWLLALALGLFFGGTMSFSFHAFPAFLARGLSETEAAFWVGVIAALTTLVRLVAGPLSDRVSRLRLFAALAGAAPAAGLVVLAAAAGTPGLALFAVLWSLGTAIGPIMESVLLARLFGTASFGAILGALGVAETVGTVLGPWAGGVIFDLTGAYTGALLLYAVGFAISATAFALGDYRRPVAEGAPVRGAS